MLPIVQPTSSSDLNNTVWPTSLNVGVDKGSSVDTLVTLLKDSYGSPTLFHLSDKAGRDRGFIDMLVNDVPLSTIHSILQSDSYDILVPPNPSTAPYIVISYADDIEEEYYAVMSNALPYQDLELLTVPSPGVTAADRDEDEVNWLSVPRELETYFHPIEDIEELEVELDDLELSPDLGDYFSRCRRFRNAFSLETYCPGIIIDSVPVIRIVATGIPHKPGPRDER